jgi:hypothetical protein
MKKKLALLAALALLVAITPTPTPDDDLHHADILCLIPWVNCN